MIEFLSDLEVHPIKNYQDEPNKFILVIASWNLPDRICQALVL